MIGVSVRDDKRGQLPHPASNQKRHDYPEPGITPAAAWPGVDNNPPACRGSHDGAVTLTYVEKM
jgi:hypothetical protein